MWSKTDTGSTATAAGTRGIHVERTGATAMLCVTEPLDLGGASQFLERAQRLAQNCGVLIVDLQGAEFIDSSGVRALLQLAEALEADRKELCLVVGAGSRVERTLALLRLCERFQCFPTLRAACGSTSSIA